MRSISAYLFFRNQGCRNALKGYCFVLFFLLLAPVHSFSQMDEPYEDISVTFTVQKIGSTEIPAIIHGQEIFLPIKDIFDFLKIKSSFSPGMDTLSGFFIDQKAEYLINKTNNSIVYRGKIFTLKNTDLIQKENDLFMKSEMFGTIFGLNCNFNFRSLSVALNTKLELPAIREMQIEKMRQNFVQLKGEKKADTVIKRSFPLFHAGTLDWAVIHTTETNSGDFTKLNVNVGALIAGGEANAYINYASNQPFELSKQYYRWRLVNNDNSLLRQVVLGTIFPQAVSSIYGNVTGVQFSNTPTTYRRSFGTYRLSDRTEPGWTVELYVNNVLINYTKADPSGFFTFEVPLVYGNSSVKLRFYGPWGEEKSREQNINVPFNFLPLHQFEYTLSAGSVDDDAKSKLARLNMNYGLGNHITIGGGVEYLSSVIPGKAMPFLTTSVRIGSGLLLSSEYTYKVRSKSILTYRLPSNLSLEVDYTKYQKGQTAIRSGEKSFNNYLEERKAILSFPFRTNKFSGFSRFSYDQLIMTNMKYTTAEMLLSGMVNGVNANFTTSAVYTDPKNPLIYSNLSVSMKVARGTRFIPQMQYDYKENAFSMFKAEIEKNIFNKGFLNLSYEKNMAHQTTYLILGVRYNFSFAQTSFSATRSTSYSSAVESARGSILYDDKLKKTEVNNLSSVGRGNLSLIPFLDLNCNGKRDTGEPKVGGLKLRINGGKVIQDKHDTTIHVIGLESYINYFVELDRSSFENISWQIRKKTMNVCVEPNRFKTIEVAVAVVGEVSGEVHLKNANGEHGQGRLIIDIFNSDGSIAGKTISESDGYFSYVGLAPGSYSVSLDKDQLAAIHMTTSTAIPFIIKQSRDGDIVDGIKLYCQAGNSTEPQPDKKNDLKDTDGDGVPDYRDKELITPRSCFPVDEDGVGKCPVIKDLKELEPDKS